MFPSRIISAPMAGGPTTPELVLAVGRAGGLGILAGGLKTPEQLRSQIDSVRAAGGGFGVNLFVPNHGQPDESELQRYRGQLQADACRYGVDIPAVHPDDDAWQDKLELLLADPVPFASFTFGLPPTDTVTALRKRGTVVMATVTNGAEAAQAAEAGVDALVVQHPHAGGHSGTFTPRDPHPESAADAAELIRIISRTCALPLIAAGGIADGLAARRTLEAGAAAVQLGTLFLRTEESGASPLHKAALASGLFTETAVTRAFSGRPARGLANRFMREHADAPHGYPAVQQLTSTIRKAAVAAGDADGVNLWAGTGFRAARETGAAGVVTELLGQLG
jgi:nitronate monooxygenase